MEGGFCACSVAFLGAKSSQGSKARIPLYSMGNYVVFWDEIFYEFYQGHPPRGQPGWILLLVPPQSPQYIYILGIMETKMDGNYNHHKWKSLCLCSVQYLHALRTTSKYALKRLTLSKSLANEIPLAISQNKVIPEKTPKYYSPYYVGP